MDKKSSFVFHLARRGLLVVLVLIVSPYLIFFSYCGILSIATWLRPGPRPMFSGGLIYYDRACRYGWSYGEYVHDSMDNVAYLDTQRNILLLLPVKSHADPINLLVIADAEKMSIVDAQGQLLVSKYIPNDNSLLVLNCDGGLDVFGIDSGFVTSLHNLVVENKKRGNIFDKERGVIFENILGVAEKGARGFLRGGYE